MRRTAGVLVAIGTVLCAGLGSGTALAGPGADPRWRFVSHPDQMWVDIRLVDADGRTTLYSTDVQGVEDGCTATAGSSATIVSEVRCEGQGFQEQFRIRKSGAEHLVERRTIGYDTSDEGTGGKVASSWKVVKRLPATATRCVPSCGDRECGSDGCGGSCGICGSFTTCQSGLCKETGKRPASGWSPPNLDRLTTIFGESWGGAPASDMKRVDASGDLTIYARSPKGFTLDGVPFVELRFAYAGRRGLVRVSLTADRGWEGNIGKLLRENYDGGGFCPSPGAEWCSEGKALRAYESPGPSRRPTLVFERR